MSEQRSPEGPEPTEEELRAAYEQELKRLRVEDVIVQTVVSLINLAGRKAGLAEGTEGEQDFAQLRLAIDGATGLLKLIEPQLGPDGATLRDAISQLQFAYARGVGAGAAGGAGGTPDETAAPGEAPATPEPPAPKPGDAGPAQSSGRLWVPGQ